MPLRRFFASVAAIKLGVCSRAFKSPPETSNARRAYWPPAQPLESRSADLVGLSSAALTSPRDEPPAGAVRCALPEVERPMRKPEPCETQD